jgi:hypothetical protein
MTNIADRARASRRAFALALMVSVALPSAVRSQAPIQQGSPSSQRLTSAVPMARTSTGTSAAEPLLGVRLGLERRMLATYLHARGWRVVVDSLEDVGEPALYAGSIDGHDAEIVAMFAPPERGGRVENLLLNLPVRSASELRATYAWAYRRMQKQRCRPEVADGYDAQLDSLLTGAPVAVPARDAVPTQPPMVRGHTTVESGNMDWPEAVWPAADGGMGTRLFASVLDAASPWPYQVTLWTSALYSGSCER